MKDVTVESLIVAAYELGIKTGRQIEVEIFLKGHGLGLTTEMIKELTDRQYVYSGYEPFNPITDLEAPEETIAKLRAGFPKILIIAELSMLTAGDLQERYQLTPKEVELVKAAFEHGNWSMLPDTPPPT